MDIDPAGPAPEAPQPPAPQAPPPSDSEAPRPLGEPEATTQPPLAATSRTGRNLPLAIGVGAGMGGLVFLTLLTVKATFLIYVGVAIAVALTELSSALAKRGIDIPVIPAAAGGAAVMTCMYWLGSRAALAALALTVVVILAWRMPAGPAGYVKDVTAGVFALIYLPFLASFVFAMLSAPDGPRRVMTNVITRRGPSGADSMANTNEARNGR